MCESVEHRVMCVRLANERRKRGQDSWAYRVGLCDILERHRGSTPSDEQLAAVCNDIAKELRAKLPAAFFDIHDENADLGFIDIVDNFQEASAASFAVDRENDVLPVELVDDWLVELYDWCDLNRVWIRG